MAQTELGVLSAEAGEVQGTERPPRVQGSGEASPLLHGSSSQGSTRVWHGEC